MTRTTKIFPLIRRYGGRCLGLAVVLMTTLGASRCPPYPPATLTCHAINLTVNRGTCSSLTNSCEDLSWRPGDEFTLDPLLQGVTVETTIGMTVERRVCATATAPLVKNQPVDFTYARSGEWGANTLNLTTGIPLAVTATATPTRIQPGQTVFLNATASGGVPPYTYHWGPESSLPPNPSDFIPNADAASVSNKSLFTTGDFIVVVTDSQSQVATSTVRVDVDLTLSVTAFPSSISAAQISQLNAIVAGGLPPYTYSWFPTTALDVSYPALPIATPTATTRYTVTVTDANGKFIQGSVTVVVSPLPAVTVTPHDPTIHVGQSIQLTSMVAGGMPPYSYAWSPAAGLSATNIPNPVASPLGTTTYILVVKDAVGGTGAGSTQVQVNISATASASPPAINVGSSSQLAAGSTDGAAPFTCNWYLLYLSNTFPPVFLSSSSICNPVARPPATTSYRVFVTDSHGAQDFADVTVTVSAAPPLLVTASANPPAVNPGGASVLIASVSGGTPPYMYSWDHANSLSPFSTIPNPVAIPPVKTTYTVTVTDAALVVASASATVSVNLAVNASATPATITPGGQSALSAQAAGGDPPYTYSWLPATGLSATNIPNPIASPAATTTYTVTATDATLHTVQGSVTVTVGPALSATASANPPAITVGGSSQLTAAGAGGTPPYTYNWTPATGLNFSSIPNPLASPAATTTYTVGVSDARAATVFVLVTVTVSGTPPLSVTASANPQLISTDMRSQLSAVVAGGSAPYTYSWSPATGLSSTGIPNPTAGPQVNTTYTVTVTDALGATASSAVTVRTILRAVATANPFQIPAGGSSQLTGFGAGGAPPYSFSWSPAAGLSATNISNPVASPAATTLYTLTVTDTLGATATSSINVTVN